MVQIPEPTFEGSEAKKAGFDNISEIGKERLRRVSKRIEMELADDDKQLKLSQTENKNIDLGFKVFKLDKSNFKVWNSPDTKISTDELQEQIDAFADHITPDADESSILYELILKSGYSLNVQIEKKSISGKAIYSVENGSLILCLESDLSYEVFEEIVNQFTPHRVICLDQGFSGENADSLKTNVVQLFKSNSIQFRTV